jgi:transposase
LFRLPVSWVDIHVEKMLESEENMLVLVAVSTAQTAVCPDCAESSQHIHSYYLRSPQDLPVSGDRVRLQLRVRRFRCQNQDCRRKTFAERLPEVVPWHGQRTSRLTTPLTLFAVALSGQAGSRLLSQIGMPTSADTLLRLAKQVGSGLVITPTHLGVDDFAFRRGATYGTILVDLRTHRPIDLLPDRSAAGLAAWLKEHPGVQWISRDRSQEYARGASAGAPEARQIVDRWHLLKNWREVLQRVVGRVHTSLKQRQKASGVSILPRYKLSRSSSEVAASQASRLRRLAVYEEVVGLHQQGASIEAIAEQLHISPTTVRKYIYADGFPERKYTWHGRKQIEPYIPYLMKRAQDGCTSAGVLYRDIKEQGYPGGYKGVNSWLREYFGKPGRRSSEQEKARKQHFFTLPQEEIGKTAQQNVVHSSSPQQEAEKQILLEDPLDSPGNLSWLLIQDQERLDQQERHMLAFILQEPEVSRAYTLAQQFVGMVRKRQGEQLDSWLFSCLESEIPDIQTFAEGLQKEYDPVKAALTFPFSNDHVA